MIASETALRGDVELHLPGAAPSVTEARRFTRDHLRAVGCPAEIVEAAALLASELVTNALLHARASIVILGIQPGPPIRIEVRDRNQRRPHRRTPGPGVSSGHGLVMVEALAARWGADVDGRGKTVWFELGGG